jgi:hypothetical protein
MVHLTAAEFKSRFAALVLGGGGALPKKPLDHHILYVSAALALEPGRTYSESELNEVLLQWVAEFGASFGIDHVTLRRSLVDEGYLQRDRAGRCYELAADPPYSIENSASEIDLRALVVAERTARYERKKQYTIKQE